MVDFVFVRERYYKHCFIFRRAGGGPVPDEKPIAKAELYFILQASKGEEHFTDKNWMKGVLYLTNLNMWFSTAQKKARIPLTAVKGAEKGAMGWEKVGEKALALSYEAKGERYTSLLTGPDPVLNTLRNKINQMIGATPKAEHTASMVDSKLTVLLYMGVTEPEKMRFLLAVKNEELKGAFARLINQGLVDKQGKLTMEGISYAAKVGQQGMQ